ncbi:MAG: MTH938/NDUFAF3 family protein [Pseudoxanthomonas sp.]
MFLTRELPDYAYALKSANGRSARVNELVLERSFALAPDWLLQDWPLAEAGALDAALLLPLLERAPELVLLGTGEHQVFPPAAAMAACLTRGIGIEVMTNAAAARTFNVLAAEGRKVVAGFVLGA